MPLYESEKQKSIEGFYTNINFPGSKAATPNNTPSDAVYKSRKLLEVDNNLVQQVNYLNELGEEITRDVNTLQSSTRTFVNDADALVTEEDKMKLSNLVINKLYTEPELERNITATYLGNAWAFNYVYKTIPNSLNGAYTWGGTLLKPNLITPPQGADADQMHYNQDKKLTFDECKEYAAQNGQKVFGITDAENDGGVMKGFCLLVKPELGWPFKYGSVEQKPRILHINQANNQNISVDIPIGDMGNSPVYKVNFGGQGLINYTVADSHYGYPGFGFVGVYRDYVGGERAMTYLGNGTLFDGARMAKEKGYKYFGCQWFGGRPAFEAAQSNLGGKLTSPSMRTGSIYGSNSPSQYAKFGIEAGTEHGNTAPLNYFTYGPESESQNLPAPLYKKNYTLAGKYTNAVYKLDESGLSFLHKGEVDLETHSSLAGSPQQRQLAEMQISSDAIDRLIQSKDGTEIGFTNFVSSVLTKLETNNFPYVGFGIFLNEQTNTYTLRAFGANNTTPTNQTTFQLIDDNNRLYGTANTVTVYEVHEKLKNGSLVPPRPKTLLGKATYVDNKKEGWNYPDNLVGGTNGVTQYSIRDNLTSKYFNADIDGLTPEQLQTATMTIPKCRDICNTYDKCVAFAYQGNAVDSNNQMAPRCFIKSEDPSIYSFGTEANNSSKIYVKLPNINNSSTCSKKISFGPSSLTYKVGDTNSYANYDRLSSDGSSMNTIDLKGDMTSEKKCAPWTDLEQNTSAMAQLQTKIGNNLQLYSSVISQLKKYNNDLDGQAITNKPMVDAAVKQYKVIIDKIADYAKDGSFRTDKAIAESSDVTRKSDIYIYTLWLTVAVIICIFAFMTLSKLK